MPAAVLDSSVLVSAFLAPNGPPASLLDQARQGAFSKYLSIGILRASFSTPWIQGHANNTKPH
jgi:predicted nucleic acid-binding protein